MTLLGSVILTLKNAEKAFERHKIGDGKHGNREKTVGNKDRICWHKDRESANYGRKDLNDNKTEGWAYKLLLSYVKNTCLGTQTKRQTDHCLTTVAVASSAITPPVRRAGE